MRKETLGREEAVYAYMSATAIAADGAGDLLRVLVDQGGVFVPLGKVERATRCNWWR
jgi:hypothetical protein